MSDKSVASEDGQDNQNKEPVKVILADDDKDDQDIFNDALSETEIPADLTTVNNGQELIDNLQDPSVPNPDIIFVDINMPVKDGIESLKEIKNDDTLKEIPVVVLSTSDNPKDVEKSYDAGASLYVPKPSSFRNFVFILKKVFTLKWAGALLKPFRKTFFISERNISDESSK